MTQPPPDMPMTALLRFLQFGDSMLPVGAFTFSCGLESAVQVGLVRDAAGLEEFVRVAMEQSATGDAVGLLTAHRAALAADLDAALRVDRLVHNRKLNGEARVMSVRMGRKLAELAGRILPDGGLAPAWLDAIRAGTTPGTLPVAQGLVFAALELDERHAFAAHQYGVASTILGAATRIMKVTHVETQAVLHRVTAGVEDAYERVRAMRPDAMHGFAPSLDILAAVHVQSHVRLFMS
jgi:urease accessory protein